MNKVSLREAAGRQEQSERLTDAVLSFVEGIGVIKSYNLLGEKSEELSGNFKRSRNTSLDLNGNDPVDNGAELSFTVLVLRQFSVCLLCWNRAVRFLWLMCWVFCYLYLIFLAR